MADDPRAALTALIAALERHLEACASRRGDDDPVVLAAYDDLADAFEAYDGALYDTYGEMTPLDVYNADDDSDDDDSDDDDDADDDTDELDDELDDHDDEDGDDARIYGGLGEVDLDDEER